MLTRDAECPKFSRPLKIPAFQTASQQTLSTETLRNYCQGRALAKCARRQGWSSALGPFPLLWTQFLSPPPPPMSQALL